MPRRQVKRGGRKFQPEKPLIYVFCEGESEQAYAKFLKEHFADVAVLKIPSKTGLFSNAVYSHKNPQTQFEDFQLHHIFQNIQ